MADAYDSVDIFVIQCYHGKVMRTINMEVLWMKEIGDDSCTVVIACDDVRRRVCRK